MTKVPPVIKTEILDFFKLKRLPFDNSPGVDNIMTTPLTNAIEMKLAMAVYERKFAVLTGMPGSGKSTLLRHFATKVAEPTDTKIIYITESRLSPRWLYSDALRTLGLEPKFYRGDCRRMLQNKITDLTSRCNTSICFIIDEAHLLDKEMLQEVRFFLNFTVNEQAGYDSRSMVALILAGQDELWTKLKNPDNTAILQRIDFVCRTKFLTKDECAQYIKNRMAEVGFSAELLTPAAQERVFEYTGGCMRVINKLCLHIVMYGAKAEQLPVDLPLVEQIIEQEMAL